MIGEMIAESLQISRRYAEKLAVGIPPSDFARLARVDGRPVHSNHPAWVYGHLSIYAPRIIGELGGDATAYQIPAEWMPLFDAKSQCQDDPPGTFYPPMERLTEVLARGYAAVDEILRSTPDAKFSEANPNEPMRGRFSTLGGMHNFYVGGHFMIHMGQVSAWRRMMGLGSAM